MMNFSDQIVSEAIDYLVSHYNEQPNLSFLAHRAGYEETHFQKLFRQNVGISPKRLLQYMNLRHAHQLLAEGHSTLAAAHETGLSGTGRLYDLFVTCEAVTPGDVLHKGRGLTVTYGYHPSPLGEIMIGQTRRGVCYLGFLVDGDRSAPLAKMKQHLRHAQFIESGKDTEVAAAQILSIWRGQGDESKKLRLDLHGTNLQLQVWRALLSIPVGETRTYKDIASQIGRPKASRAIGNAVGANPVSLLIPCHRVIRASGIIDNYGWGSPRKKLILAVEGAMRGGAGCGACVLGLGHKADEGRRQTGGQHKCRNQRFC